MVNGLPLKKTAEFSLSLAILNLDIHAPVLFLHIRIAPDQSTITGTCDLCRPDIQASRPITTEVTGAYKAILTKDEDEQYLINLSGNIHFDQAYPDLKITMVIDKEWKNGKVFYKYLKNLQWVSVSGVYLKIKSAEPHYVPTSILDDTGMAGADQRLSN